MHDLEDTVLESSEARSNPLCSIATDNVKTLTQKSLLLTKIK
jgi:hypothetical protein